MAPLDGLRALAVGAVVFEHGYLSQGESALFDPWAPGPAGVRLFFVLSGFLITGILLDAREAAAAAGASRRGVFGAFYMRRALRIFPLAYAVLVGAYLIGSTAVRDGAAWYFTYTSNWYSALYGASDPDLGHFWSLAIEEQFYLVWPLLLLLTPRRAVLPMMVCIALGSSAVRYWVATESVGDAYVLTISRLDALAWGGILAWTRIQGMRWRALGSAGATLLLIGLATDGAASVVFKEWAGIVLSGWLLLMALDGPAVLRRALSARPLVYVGTISYGIYVFHGVVPMIGHAAERFADVWLRIPTEPGTARFLVTLVGSTVLASISWRLFERPLNDLKRFFPYVAPARPVAGASRAPAGAQPSWSAVGSTEPGSA